MTSGGAGGSESSQHYPLQQSTSTIHEVDELTGAGGGELGRGRVGKSPSLPYNRLHMAFTASSDKSGSRKARSTVGGLGMFRSVRWKRSSEARRPPSAASVVTVGEDVSGSGAVGPTLPRRTKSLRGNLKKPLSMVESGGGVGRSSEEVRLMGRESATSVSEYSSTATNSERPRSKRREGGG